MGNDQPCVCDEVAVLCCQDCRSFARPGSANTDEILFLNQTTEADVPVHGCSFPLANNQGGSVFSYAGLLVNGSLEALRSETDMWKKGRLVGHYWENPNMGERVMPLENVTGKPNVSGLLSLKWRPEQILSYFHSFSGLCVCEGGIRLLRSGHENIRKYFVFQRAFLDQLGLAIWQRTFGKKSRQVLLRAEAVVMEPNTLVLPFCSVKQSDQDELRAHALPQEDHVLSDPLPRVHTLQGQGFWEAGGSSLHVGSHLKAFLVFAKMLNPPTSCSWSEFWALRTLEELLRRKGRGADHMRIVQPAMLRVMLELRVSILYMDVKIDFIWTAAMLTYTFISYTALKLTIFVIEHYSAKNTINLKRMLLHFENPASRMSFIIMRLEDLVFEKRVSRIGVRIEDNESNLDIAAFVQGPQNSLVDMGRWREYEEKRQQKETQHTCSSAVTRVSQSVALHTPVKFVETLVPPLVIKLQAFTKLLQRRKPEAWTSSTHHFVLKDAEADSSALAKTNEVLAGGVAAAAGFAVPPYT
ncbi:UNVERIFIED_CONTAM: hypothetical protein H355_014331 [Colinus virginianus]|nr:hypothetical protein H355_014331 [Colinus virginianus]